MSAASTRKYPWLLPRWLWIFLVLGTGLVIWIRWFVDAGDRGFNNLLTMLVAILTGIVVAVWFVFCSRFSRSTRYGALIAGILAVTAFFSLFRFHGVSGSLVPQISRRSTGESPPVPSLRAPAAGVDLATTTPADFPGFGGPDRSMMVAGVRLARDWSRNPPEAVWRQPIGAGWSGFAVVNGVAVTMEQREEEEMVIAYALMSGEILWSHAMAGRFSHPLGGVGPRSTPQVDEGRVYALSTRGLLLCLDGSTGTVLWQVDLLHEYGLTPEQEFALVQYGRSNSPLVVGDLVVIPAGGNPDRPPASLAAYDKRTGEKVWEGGTHQISFSSPRLATLAGVRQILILNEDTASGHDPDTGRLLWEHPWPGRTAANATSSQAVPVSPDRVFMSKGYGEGAALLRLLPRDEGTFEARELWHNRQVLRTKFTNVVLRNGHVYGLSDGILECVDLETGERVWKRGRYHHGQILGVGDTLLVLGEDGELVHIDPSPDRPNDVLGRIQALEGQTWNHLALYGPYLAVRNGQEAAVYRLPLAGTPDA